MNSQIYSNMDSVRNYNIFNQNRTNASNAMNRATTGLKIASVQDGPAKWAVSEKMRERINSLNQANQNVQNDTTLMKTAEGGINNTIEVLNTLKARVLQAVDTDSNDSDRITLAKEMKTLFEQIEYNATSTRYNGKLLLATAKTSANKSDVGDADTTSNTDITLRFQIGDDNNSYASFKLQNMTLKGLDLWAATNSVGNLASLTISQINNDTAPVAFLRPGGGDTFITALNNALESALNAATDIGSYEQRLGYVADNVATQIENLEASDSTIRSSDMAKEITEYMKWSVLSQASQYMLAQSNQNAFSALNLLLQ